MTATKVEFARESLTDTLWAEAMPLLAAHKDEIAHYADIPLEPDIDAYRAAEAAGAVRVFTARRETNVRHGPIGMPGSAPIPSVREQQLVGYAVFTVRPNPHYKSSLQAFQDVLYLDPERRGITGYRFIKWCDEQLAAEGVQAVYHHLKAAHDHPALMHALGYEVVDIIYAKRLDR